jgi:hypothetical protein
LHFSQCRKSQQIVSIISVPGIKGCWALFKAAPKAAACAAYTLS